MQEAKQLLEAKGYDCQDDYFLETEEDLNADIIKPYRPSYTPNYKSEY